MKRIQAQQKGSPSLSSGANTTSLALGQQSKSSSAILLPSIHDIQSLRVSPLASDPTLLPSPQTPAPAPMLVTTKNNYSHHSLSNKIILSVLQCLQHLCELNFDWKDHQTESIPSSYRYRFQRVASNPMTELVSVSVLLILPLMSHCQVSSKSSFLLSFHS
jgi:hypothetical protein